MIIIFHRQESFIWVLKSNHITSERSNQMTRAEIDCLYPTVHMKDQGLWNVFSVVVGLFWTPFNWISHRIQIVTSCSQLPARCGIFCHLVEVVYRSCGSQFLYPTINFTFLRIIVGLNFLKILLAQIWMILSRNKSWPNIFFPFLSKALWSRINHIYQPLRSGRIWHSVNFLAKFNRFEFRVFLLLG